MSGRCCTKPNPCYCYERAVLPQFEILPPESKPCTSQERAVLESKEWGWHRSRACNSRQLNSN